MNKDASDSGTPDLEFGIDGLAMLPDSMRYAGHVTPLPGNAALAAGASTKEGKFIVTRLLDNGTIDTRFAARGVIEGQVLPQQASMAVAAFGVDSNKTIVVVTTTTEGADSMPCVVRYTNEGSLDPAYGQGGVVQLPYPAMLGNEHPPRFVRATHLTSSTSVGSGQMPSGEIVVGWWYISEGKTLIYRLDDTGSLDTSFGKVGYVTYPEALGHSSLSALSVLPSGKILVIGEHRSESGVFYPFLVRYTRTGALDEAFGNDGSGVVQLQLQAYAGYVVNASLETAEGGLIVFGRDAEGTAKLIGLANDGSIDPTFRPDEVPQVFQWLSATYDGKTLVAAGHTTDPRYIIIARFNPDGSLDTAFGNNSGWVRVDHLSIPVGPTPYDVKSADGKIFIAGGDFVMRLRA